MEWYGMYYKRFVKMGFKRLVSNICVYYWIKDNVIIGLYIDDLLIFTPKNNYYLINDIK